MPPPGKLPPSPGAREAARSAREREPTQEVTTPPPDEDAMPTLRSDPPPRLDIPTDITGEPLPAIAQFGRFEIMGGLASGGMADILLARDSTEGSVRHTVIKIVRGEHAEDGEFANMFLDEGRLAMRLSHPNICTVYECGHADGRYFMAMEYVHGRTLREVIARAVALKEQIPIPILARLFAGLAEALDFAHRTRDARGNPLDIVHRDVSPQNVMIRYDGVVKLLDFGVAKAQRRVHETQSGALKGKYAYMSPEQAVDEKVDGRSDIFALGIMLFEAVTGRRLFKGKNQFSTLKRLLEADPPPVAKLRRDVPDRLQQILDRSLAKDPADRYERAADMQHDLERLIAKSGKVVSAAHLAELMQHLFAESAYEPPELDTSDAVAERFASLEPHASPSAERSSAPVELAPPKPAGSSPVALVVGAGVAAVAVLALVLGLALWPDGADSTPSGSPPREVPSDPDPVALEPPEPPSIEANPDPVADPPPPEVGSPPTEATHVAAPPEETESAPAETSSRRRGTRRGRRGRLRRGTGDEGGGTVIVSDPGF